MSAALPSFARVTTAKYAFARASLDELDDFGFVFDHQNTVGIIVRWEIGFCRPEKSAPVEDGASRLFVPTMLTGLRHPPVRGG